MSFLLGIMSLVLTSLAFILRKSALGYSAAGFWVVFAVYCYTASTVTWDVYYGMFLLGCGMTILCALEPVVMREKHVEEKLDDPLEGSDKIDAEYQRHSKGMRAPMLGFRRKKKHFGI